jgi:hypothetical protein
MYCCGSAEHALPPLRILTPADMPSKNLRKRLSDYLQLLRPLVQHLRDRGAWVERPTIEQANHMFDLAAAVVDLPTVTEKQRKRRVTQLQWSTVASLLRGKRHHGDGAPGQIGE